VPGSSSRYRVGGEVALSDAEGDSNISDADFAHKTGLPRLT
jgi:putative NADH-flavin reductase